MTPDQTASLPPMRGDGQTMKPEALDGQVVTVLSSQTVIRKDGSTGHKWLVKHDDNTLALYWAPGMAPPQQVHQFFRQYPDRELRLLVTRHANGEGFARWQVQQMEAPVEADGGPSEDEAVDEIPF